MVCVTNVCTHSLLVSAVLPRFWDNLQLFWVSLFISQKMFFYILYFFVPSSYLYHLRIFLLHIDLICLLCKFTEKHLLYRAFLNLGVGLQRRFISTNYKCARTNFSYVEYGFLLGKWRYGVWDMLLYLNVREGNEWMKELFDKSRKYLLNLLQCCIPRIFVILWHNAITLTLKPWGDKFLSN